MKIYDLIIIGAGPAGLTSAIYAGRSKLDTLVIEKAGYGGQIAGTEGVENYPGSIEDETGVKLTQRMKDQAVKFGAEFINDEIIEYDFSDKIKILKSAKETYKTKSVIIAVGAKPKELGVKGEKEFTGAGVSYCATCDGAFFKDVEVFVIGGGDTALQEGIYLTKYASHVNIVHRRDSFRAAKILQEKASKNPKISFIFNSVLEEIKGDGLVKSVVLKDVNTGELKEYFPNNAFNTFGIFVFVGYQANTQIFKSGFNLSPTGNFITGEDMKLQDGIYAAGDCREKSLRQVVTATSDGAIAAMEVEKYIEFNFEEEN